MKKCDILMARSLRSLAGGFVWGSTGISSQKRHYSNYSFTIIYSFNKMKKQKSSIIALTSPESSGDESEKAMPKIDKEELRKYLQNSDEEDESSPKNTPKKSKKLVKKRKTSSHANIDQDKPKKLIQKDSPQKYLLQGDDFKRLQKQAKNLAPLLLIILKEKITNIWLNTTT